MVSPGSASRAQTAQSSGLQQSSLDDYAGHLRSLRALAVACGENAAACDIGHIGPDEHVSLGAGAGFDAHYDWLSSALTSAKGIPDAERAALMQRAEAHIDADLADAQPSAAQANFSDARRRADAILAEREFRTSQDVSLWQIVMAHLYAWLDRLLGHVVAFGARSPWIGPLLEWLLIAIAGALLLVWAFRTVGRQRLRLRAESARQTEQTEERVLNWMREAEACATRGAFRDAVHCLYWASIATLEGRRLWQPDRSRTPREYLRLLDPVSPASTLLRRQTFSFETIWYGLCPARRSDYDSALDLHRQLRAA